MGRLEDRLLNHPLRGTIATIRARLSEFDQATLDAAEQHSQGTVARIPQVLTFIEGVLATADPALTTASALAALEAALTNADNNLSALSDQHDVISSVDHHLEEALTAASSLAPVSPLSAKRAMAAKRAFDSALVSTVREIEQRSASLAENLRHLEEKRVEAAAQITAEDAQRGEALTSATDALESRLAEQEQRVDQLVPTLQEQFDAAQAARREAFETLQSDLRERAEGITTEIEAHAAQTRSMLAETAEAVLDEVRRRKQEVDQLYGIITDTSTTGAFRDEARAQKDAADTWRKVAVGFGVAAALLAIIAFVLSAVRPGDVSSTSAVVAKITATLVAAGVAAYAGRQSGNHREREEEAKRLELELAAFPPFIESLDEAQRREVRKAFSDRAFRGRPADAPARRLFRKNDSFGVGLPELVDAIVAAVRRADQASQA
jgi:DNA repair exonuclease SbcCD ATPase subunit